MLPETRARIEAITDSPMGYVGTDMQLSAVLQHPPGCDIECYVVPVSERPKGDKHTTGPAIQAIDVTVGVVFAIRALNDPTGEYSREPLQSARDAVRDALYGWKPLDRATRYMMAGGELVRMEHGTIWWIDRYQSQIQRRSNPENLK